MADFRLVYKDGVDDDGIAYELDEITVDDEVVGHIHPINEESLPGVTHMVSFFSDDYVAEGEHADVDGKIYCRSWEAAINIIRKAVRRAKALVQPEPTKPYRALRLGPSAQKRLEEIRKARGE
jgi:hypothetical protein